MGSVGRAWPLLLRYQASQLTTPVMVTCLVRRRLLLAVDQLTVPVYKELSCVQSVYLIGGQHHCKDYYLPRCNHIDLAFASQAHYLARPPPSHSSMGESALYLYSCYLLLVPLMRLGVSVRRRRLCICSLQPQCFFAFDPTASQSLLAQGEHF